MRQIWVWQIFLFNSLLEPLSWGAASNSESWVRGVSCLVHLPLSLHDQREAMLCSQTCPIASWLCCEHHKAVIPGLPVLPHTHPDRNGQSCCLISSREEGGVGSPPPLLGSALGRGSGNLPLAGQNTKCFPKPPAHRAQLPEQIGSLILRTTLHRASKLLAASSAFPSHRSKHPQA